MVRYYSLANEQNAFGDVEAVRRWGRIGRRGRRSGTCVEPGKMPSFTSCISRLGSGKEGMYRWRRPCQCRREQKSRRGSLSGRWSSGPGKSGVRNTWQACCTCTTGADIVIRRGA
ncbi:MAG TPA: WGR domain-containing protein [Pararhizobium sp.]|uniref:WGR domain-containing protein n=1 Tax=Pararhizobium sp. TaxID=1977563 RepID=UPI002B95C706|nr:WGR domain-containing protein [Pararhizobium sp.]HTO34346.1 WGR domain-containing protein [Pararhizobium sp.]